MVWTGMQATHTPIGIVRSIFPEKFGIPRQAGLVMDTEAHIDILPPFNEAEAFRGLEGFSHIWIVSYLHAGKPEKWKPTVRPPRLGGNRRIGVFATRSPSRPNPIGLSAVKLKAVSIAGPDIRIAFLGGDLLDGTPVLDIKPYIPYADAVPSADGGYAVEIPKRRFAVRFSDEAAATCRQKKQDGFPQIEAVIRNILALDPRPAYRAVQDGQRQYKMAIFDLDVCWSVENDSICVHAIVRR